MVKGSHVGYQAYFNLPPSSLEIEDPFSDSNFTIIRKLPNLSILLVDLQFFFSSFSRHLLCHIRLIPCVSPSLDVDMCVQNCENSKRNLEITANCKKTATKSTRTDAFVMRMHCTTFSVSSESQ